MILVLILTCVLVSIGIGFLADPSIDRGPRVVGAVLSLSTGAVVGVIALYAALS